MFIWFVWAILVVLVGLLGKERRIGFWGAFALAFFLSPIIGGVITLFSDTKAEMRRQEQEREAAA